MSEIVNLRQARKRKARAAAEAEAAVRRVQFGRPKAETELETARQQAERRKLEGHRLTPDEP